MTGCTRCPLPRISTALDDAYVGVRVRGRASLTLCFSDGHRLACGDQVIVELDSGPACGEVERSPMPVFKPCQKASSKRILRPANEGDLEKSRSLRAKEADLRRFCQQRSGDLGLELKVSRVELAFNGKSATVHFTANGRIDFRQLVRETSRRFSVRVKMLQVGARDEAGLLGGIGVCGQSLCCSAWLKDFKPISIQMAKRQNLSLNPSKISGQCGRLLCCLAYEEGQYTEQKGKLPVLADT